MPNTQWGQTNRKVGVWSRERIIAGLVPKNPPTSLKHFSKAFLKARWERVIPKGMWSTPAQFSGWWWSILSHQQVWGLRAHDRQVVHFFHLVVVFSKWKTQEICMRYYYLGSQRGTTAEDMGEGSVLGRPRSVLLRYRFYVMYILPQFLKSRTPSYFINMIPSNRSLVIM